MSSTHPSRAPSHDWNRTDWKILFALFALACLMFFPSLGTPGLLNSSDAYYSEGAREMIKRNDLLTPYLNFVPFYDKPILIYWLIIASYKVFGVSTFASRLPSAACAVASVLALYALIRPLSNRRVAALAAVSLICTPLFVIVGHLALTDMPLMFFTSTACLLMISALNGIREKLLPLAYVALGLGFLCKGPVAILVVTCCIVGYLLVTTRSLSEFKELIWLLKPLKGLAVFLAITMPWFVAEHMATDGAFTRSFFIDQNFGRLSGKLASHVQPAWFYIPYLLGGFFPWFLMLFQAPVVLKLYKKRFSQSRKDRLIIAACCWLVGTLAVLFITKSKLPTYLLPVATPIAILSGFYLNAVIRLGRRRFIFWTAPLMVLGGTASFLVFPQLFIGADDLRDFAIASVALFVVGFVMYGAFIYGHRVRTGVVTLYACCYLACALLVPIGLLEVYKTGTEAFRSLIQVTKQNETASVAVLAKDSSVAAYYLDKRVFEIVNPEDCDKFISTTSNPHYLIVNDKNFSRVESWFNNKAPVVEKRQKWRMLLVNEGLTH